jgi:hypothetical protein
VKRPISLIEIMILLAVLAVSLGGLGIRGVAALRQHRFEAATDEVVSILNLAQHLMLCCHLNVALRIDQRDKGYTVELIGDDELPDRFKAVAKGARFLRGVDRITFDGREELPLLLPFSTDLPQRMPQGVLTLASRRRTLVHVALPGHVSQISKCYGDYPTYPPIAASPYPQATVEESLSTP